MRPVDQIFPNAKRQEHIDKRQCNRMFGCGKEIWDMEREFRDEISRKEYELTGLCQDCQDGVFDGPEVA